jgi:hypothetical protein
MQITGVLKNCFGRGSRYARSRVSVGLISSSIGVFSDDKSEFIAQVTAYKIAASDLTRNVEVEVVFPRLQKVKQWHVTYNIDLRGFESKISQENVLKLHLDHPLDVTRQAFIYVWTVREYTQPGLPEPQLPEIHVKGRTRDNKVVYR